MARLGIIHVDKTLFERDPNLFETYFPDCRSIIELEMTRERHDPSARRFQIECDEFDDLSENEAVPFYGFWFQEVRHIDPPPLGAKQFNGYYRLRPIREPWSLAAQFRTIKRFKAAEDGD